MVKNNLLFIQSCLKTNINLYMKNLTLLLLTLFISCKDFGNPVSVEEDNSYSYVLIQEIFNNNCITCHYNDSGLISYESYDDVITGGSIGSEISNSVLYDRITRLETDDGDMPPAGNLTNEQIELIELWINEGALEDW